MYDAARESLEHLRRWMTWCSPEYAPADAYAFVSQCPEDWANNDHYSFAILDERENKFLGSVALNQLNLPHKCANVGYWVRESAKGRGAATIATRLVSRFAFRELGMERLEFLIPSANVASRRVARKAGARFEGSLRGRILINGVRHDAALYALLAGDLADS